MLYLLQAVTPKVNPCAITTHKYKKEGKEEKNQLNKCRGLCQDNLLLLLLLLKVVTLLEFMHKIVRKKQTQSFVMRADS